MNPILFVPVLVLILVLILALLTETPIGTRT
jgi:hypothetical protein